jgi:hypothetical protein
MQYADQSMDIDTPAGLLRVIVTGEALKAMAGKPASPAEAVLQMNQHQELFARIARKKHAAEEGEEDGLIRVTPEDLDPSHRQDRKIFRLG